MRFALFFRVTKIVSSVYIAGICALACSESSEGNGANDGGEDVSSGGTGGSTGGTSGEFGMSGSGGTAGISGGSGGAAASNSGGAAASDSGGRADASDGSSDGGSVAPADSPFACGSDTCSVTQYCIHPCCGGAPPPCMSMPEGGACPIGFHQGCSSPMGACSNPQNCCEMDPCTPPPAYCADTPPQGCLLQGGDCFLLCA